MSPSPSLQTPFITSGKSAVKALESPHGTLCGLERNVLPDGGGEEMQYSIRAREGRAVQAGSEALNSLK